MRPELLQIGTKIKNRRELLGLQQSRLADITKVSRRTIQLIEAGKANPSLDILLKITDALGLAIKLNLKSMEESADRSNEPV